jgi:hypothetical protein
VDKVLGKNYGFSYMFTDKKHPVSSKRTVNWANLPGEILNVKKILPTSDDGYDQWDILQPNVWDQHRDFRLHE